MAASFYSAFLEKQGLGTNPAWATITPIGLALLDATYTFASTHEFMSDGSPTPASAVVVTQDLGALAISVDGTEIKYDAGNETFSAVSGADIVALVIYANLGADTVDQLIMFNDAPAIAVSPNGGDIIVNWAATGIIRVPYL